MIMTVGPLSWTTHRSCLRLPPVAPPAFVNQRTSGHAGRLACRISPRPARVLPRGSALLSAILSDAHVELSRPCRPSNALRKGRGGRYAGVSAGYTHRHTVHPPVTFCLIPAATHTDQARALLERFSNEDGPTAMGDGRELRQQATPPSSSSSPFILPRRSRARKTCD